MPAWMWRSCTGCRRAYFDCGCGVGTTREMEPVAEDHGVVKKPDERRGDDSRSSDPEGTGTKHALAKLNDADRCPREQRKYPAVVPGEYGCNEHCCDAGQETGGAGWIVVEGSVPLHQPDC